MSTTLLIKDGDVVMSNGQPVIVKDKPKLNQDLQENFTISKQPSGFGAGLDDDVGFVTNSETAFKVQVFQTISDSIDAIKSLQDRYVRAARPTSERISSLQYLNVELLQGSATDYLIRVDVDNVDGDIIQLQGQISPIGG